MKSRQKPSSQPGNNNATPVQQQKQGAQTADTNEWAAEAQSTHGNAFIQTLMNKGRNVQAEGELGGEVHAIAAEGTQGSGSELPHLDVIQASFGTHEISNVQAHVGGAAAQASEAMGAEAYATGNDVAFGSAPDLHTAAHEAAHVVQQRGGVALKDGVGQAGDMYEQHADKVADAVVQGQSAEGILDKMAGASGGSSGDVQRRAVQREGEKEAGTTPKHDASEFKGDNGKLKILKEAITTALSMVKKASAKAKLGNADYQLWMDAGATSDTSDSDTKARATHVKTGLDTVQKCLEKDEVIFKEWDDPDKSEYDDVYAYVYSGQKENNIYLGGAFWVAETMGIDSRAGTIIHELTHHLHNTEDHHYGSSDSQTSAKKTPAKATTNADNYEHFSESA